MDQLSKSGMSSSSIPIKIPTLSVSMGLLEVFSALKTPYSRTITLNTTVRISA